MTNFDSFLQTYSLKITLEIARWWYSLLDNAPNSLVRCVIQKRYNWSNTKNEGKLTSTKTALM